MSETHPAAPRVIFLDAVGTLIHPEPPAPTVYATVGCRFGSRREAADVAARFRTAFARQEEQDRAAGLRTDEAREIARWRAIVAEVLDDVADPEACFQALYQHFAGPDAWRCEPGTAPLLRALADRGFRLGMASNFDERLRRLVAALPELRPIRHLVISSEVGWRKPAAAFFAQVCREAGEPADEVLFVGDDPANDYDGARAAGLRALLFDPRRRQAVPDHARLPRLEDLLTLPGYES